MDDQESSLRLNRIEKKLDSIQVNQNTLSVAFARHQALEESYQQNMEVFFTKNWPEMVGKIDLNATKIAKLEVEIAIIRTRMAIWATGLTVGVPVLATILQLFINEVLNK